VHHIKRIKWSIALTGLWICLTACFLPSRVEALTSAGTLVFTQSKATYFDPVTGSATESSSNSVVVSIGQIASLEVTENAKALVPQGQQVQFFHHVTNVGNGLDTMTLSLSWSGAFTPSQIEIFDDINQNGRVDSGEIPVTVLHEIKKGESRSVIVLAAVPSTAKLGDTTAVVLSVRSALDLTKVIQTTDTLEVNNETVNAASLSAIPVGEVVPDRPIEYALSVTNVGIKAADPIVTPVLVRSGAGTGTEAKFTGVLVSLPLPSNTVFEQATAVAPKEALLIYRMGETWTDSILSEEKGKVTGAGMIILANNGVLLPAQVAILKMTAVTLRDISSTTIHAAGSVSHQSTHAGGGIITGKSNALRHELMGPSDSVSFTNGSKENSPFYHSGDSVYLILNAASMNQDSARIETPATATVFSSFSGDQKSVNIVETGENTGIFIASFGTVQSTSSATTSAPRASKPVVEDAVLVLPPNTSLRVDFVNPKNKTSMGDDVIVDPSGVVFNSVTNTPLSGVTVTLIHDETGAVVVPLGTRPNPVVTGADGRFVFEVPAGQYRLALSNLPAGFAFPSVMSIPNLTAVGWKLNPAGSYGRSFTLTNAVTFDLPVDDLAPILIVQKTANKRDVEIGDRITYTINIRNSSPSLPVLDVRIFDHPPAGITYLAGSATCTPPGGTVPQPLADPAPVRPIVFQPSCTVPTSNRVGIGETILLTYQAVVGPGAIVGNGVNRAEATGRSLLGPTGSNQAIATVKIVPGVFTDRAIVIGKVFIDLNGNGDQETDEPGVPAIRLILENGSSATTDEEGKYSLAGLTPTTHVLTVDSLTLPAPLTLSDSSTRFAGDPRSRFVDLTPGELHKANFTIEALPKAVWEPILRDLKKKVSNKEWAMGVRSPSGGAKGMGDGREGPRPVGEGSSSLSFVEDVAKQTSPEGEAGSDPSENSHVVDLKAIVTAASPELVIVFPEDLAVIPIRSTRLVITGHAGLDYRLRINNQPVPDDRIGSVVMSKERPVAAVEWIAVSLQEGENQVEVLGYDGFGNLREEAKRTLFVPGAAHQIILSVDPKTLPADGTSTTTVTIRITDQTGMPVLTRTFLTVSTTKGDLKAKDLNTDIAGIQIAVEEGVAHLTLTASKTVEDAVVTARLGSEEAESFGESTVSFLPALREMVAVGILDGRMDLRRFKGNLRPVDPLDRFDESLRESGRGALYLKGKISGSALLTLSYDSDKVKKDPLFQDIQPEAFYPIYGDSSEKEFDAQSSQKLYLKVEKGKSYLLFGDFSPDFTEGELLSYQRSFSGLKYHFEDQKSSVTTFANESRQHQVVERIPANGTSGFYQLTQFPIVENSDRVEIVTVERERPDIVIQSVVQSRFTDYMLDVRTGKILFKGPVSRFDRDLNPVFIKVTYETEGTGSLFYTYGVNAKMKFFDRLQIGSTLIRSEDPMNPLSLYGGNLKINLMEGAILSHEIAESEAMVKDRLVEGSGQKSSLSIKRNAVDANAYFLTTDPSFRNPSANVSGGKIETGLRLHYRIEEGTLLTAEQLISEDENIGTQRAASELKVERAFGSVTLDGGFRHIEDRSPLDRLTIDTARAKIAAPIPSAPKLTGSLEYERALHQDADIITLGSDYRIDARTKLYGKQQWISGDSDLGRVGIGRAGRRSIALLGIDSAVTPETTAFSEYRIANALSGREGQAAVGLRNRYAIREGITVSSTFEQTRTVEGAQRQDDATVFSAGLEHLARPDLKGSTRYEIRKATILTSQLWTGALAYRAAPGLSLLSRETLYFEDGKIPAVEKWFSRLILGAALRPTRFDWINGLAKYDFKYESEGRMLTRVHVGSIENNIVVAPRTTLFLKYANRMLQEEGIAGGDFHSTTQMAESRVTYDLTPKIDVGVEARKLWQRRFHSQLWGYGIEGGYRLAQNFWLSVGYQVNGLDEEAFADDHALTSGPYIRLRYKFGDHLVDFLRGGSLTIKGEKPAPSPPVVIPLPLATPIFFPGIPLPVPAPILIPVSLSVPSVSYELTSPPKLVIVEGGQPEISFSLTDVQFGFGLWQLTSAEKERVARYAEFLKRNPDSIVQIQGHTDRVGTVRYNKQLGMKRAKEISKTLKKAGVINPIEVTSRGKLSPLDRGNTARANQRNRRVELRVKE
jgi:uncharacterized repeat protein (TIGR01451 family)